MSFDDVMSQIAADEDSNNSDETVDQGYDTGDDTGEVDQSQDGGDNSQETEPGFDPNTLSPELQTVYKQMQREFTPRLQEAAQLRQQYGDLKPEVVDAVREYQRLLQTDPWSARNYLAQQQAFLDQRLGVQQQQQDPFANVEPVTPTEQALLNWAKQAYQHQQALQQETQQLKFQRFQEQMERQFSQLETQYKAKIPLEERQQVGAFMQATGISDVATAWKAMNFDKAMQAGNQRQQKVVQQKKQLPPTPANRNPRPAQGTTTPKKGQSISDMLNDAWNKSGV